MSIQLFNSATRQKEVFTPYNSNDIGVYVCGPTVYDHIHIGNARPLIVFDILHRLLKHYYNDKVTFVRNITDIDDKINTRAHENNIDIFTLTTQTAQIFMQECDALYCLKPTHEPRATDHIADMLALIEQLISRGHAYSAQNHVLFDTSSMADYGVFARKSLDDLIEGARVEVAPFKRNPSDFVLWKPSSDITPGWDSPYGYGRPGWHIECSAMSLRYLGKNFDIHAGGIDLVFPHHQNEIAQSCCAFDDAHFAKYWLHNGYVMINGEKMSKSLGNFVTVSTLLEKHHGEVLRFSLLMTHYRQPLNFTEKRLDEAKHFIDKIYRIIEKHPNISTDMALIEPAISILADDMNTPKLITLWQEWLKIADKDEEAAIKVISLARFLGFGNETADNWFRQKNSTLSNEEIEQLLAKRANAKTQKDFTTADAIRDELLAHNITLEDTPQGTIWRTT